MDPAAKQTLEQVLGTGGSQFPVSIMLKKSVVKGGDEGEHDASLDEDECSPGFDDENQGIQGKMFVN